MNRKSTSENMPIGKIFSLGWKTYMEVLEAETPGFFGKLSCLWIKLVVIGYLAAPILLLIAAALPFPEYMFERHLSLANLVLYLLAAFPLLLIAFLPHKLVFAVQNNSAASEATSHIHRNRNS